MTLYSLRRQAIDAFLEREGGRFPAGGVIVDVGGVLSCGRGTFSFPCCRRRVTMNLSREKLIDVQADGANLPAGQNAFDGAVCTEVLEHVPDPRVVLGELARVLRPGAVVLVTVPLLSSVHRDPEDYGRYTPMWWQRALEATGFDVVRIEAQGGLWSVIIDLLRSAALQRGAGRLVRAALRLAQWLARRRDASTGGLWPVQDCAATTGYGIVARRR